MTDRNVLHDEELEASDELPSESSVSSIGPSSEGIDGPSPPDEAAQRILEDDELDDGATARPGEPLLTSNACNEWELWLRKHVLELPISGLAKPHRGELDEDEKDTLARCWAPVLAKHAPDAIIPVEVTALMATVVIVGPRLLAWAKDRKQAKALPAPESSPVQDPASRSTVLRTEDDDELEVDELVDQVDQYGPI